MKKCIFDYARLADRRNFGGVRLKFSVKGFVIHYTAVDGDTAKNECDAFATHVVKASAHIFIDAEGKTGYSVPITRVAWSVGNPHGWYETGTMGKILNNTNTVSIELCDMIGHGITKPQKVALIKTLKWLKKKCKNAQYICRHYDVCTKNCPAWYVDHPQEWKKLQKELLKNCGMI